MLFTKRLLKVTLYVSSTSLSFVFCISIVLYSSYLAASKACVCYKEPSNWNVPLLISTRVHTSYAVQICTYTYFGTLYRNSGNDYVVRNRSIRYFPKPVAKAAKNGATPLPVPPPPGFIAKFDRQDSKTVQYRYSSTVHTITVHVQ